MGQTQQTNDKSKTAKAPEVPVSKPADAPASPECATAVDLTAKAVKSAIPALESYNSALTQGAAVMDTARKDIAGLASRLGVSADNLALRRGYLAGLASVGARGAATIVRTALASGSDCPALGAIHNAHRQAIAATSPNGILAESGTKAERAKARAIRVALAGLLAKAKDSEPTARLALLGQANAHVATLREVIREARERADNAALVAAAEAEQTETPEGASK